MKKGLIGALAVLGVAATTGCSYFGPTPPAGYQPPTQREQLCAELKRKLTFYHTDLNMDTEWSSPTKRAALMQQYKENHCDQKDRTDTVSDTAAPQTQPDAQTAPSSAAAQPPAVTDATKPRGD